MNATEDNDRYITAPINDIDIQDLNIIRLKYFLQKEVGTAIYLRTEMARVQSLQKQQEQEEDARLLVALPQLTMTRMLVQDLLSQSRREQDPTLRQEYILRYQAMQKEYAALSQAYDLGVHQFEIKRMAFTRKVEKFNQEVDRHNQNLLQSANKVNHFKRAKSQE